MRRVAVALAAGVTLLPHAAAAHAAAHLGGGAAETDISIGRVLASLILCLGVAVAIIVLMRGRGARFLTLTKLARQPAGDIEVVQTRKVSSHADISLVRHDGQEYLLLLQAGSARLLRQTSDATQRGDDA